MMTTISTTLMTYIFFLIFIINIHISFGYELSNSGLCAIEGDSTDCAQACSMLDEGQSGVCIYDSCFCADIEMTSCYGDDDHEACDSVCEDMSSSLIGLCMNGQCSCLS
ncbi:hypothetical protein BDC45DRAFT_515965 [Circinella umbellata]|nr:hypothetical protein BDC45DRAFT_515965 [Circinella umbellata]